MSKNKMNYFNNCKTIDEAKKHYRELLKQYHPDIAREEGQAATIMIIDEFEKFIDCFMSASFNEYYADKYEKPDMSTITPFQEVLKKIIHLECDIEIIDYWIYCFHAENVRAELEQLGFWHSSKHKAHIYSGKKKSRYATKVKLAELRTNKGMIKKAM
jgi:curved DNA-binding protein CbpA